MAVGAINIAAAATVGRDSTQNLAFFVVVAAAQLVWGAVAMIRAPRWWLALGAAGNLVVVTWVVSRTAGLSRGQVRRHHAARRFPRRAGHGPGGRGRRRRGGADDPGRGPARSAARSPRVAVAAAVVAGALTLAGVLSQADAFGSSPTGNGTGVNGPAAPGGGGGTGGGTTGGGYPGY